MGRKRERKRQIIPRRSVEHVGIDERGNARERERKEQRRERERERESSRGCSERDHAFVCESYARYYYCYRPIVIASRRCITGRGLSARVQHQSVDMKHGNTPLQTDVTRDVSRCYDTQRR